MKNKGFTLVELLLVIVIIAIITVIAIPNIMEALDESKKQGGNAVEKLLIKNLELYNIDQKKDLWCLDEEGFNCDSRAYNCRKVLPKELYSMNSDIDMGECLFRNDTSIYIKKMDNGNFEYYVDIVCGKNLIGNEDKIVDQDSLENAELYYQTDDFSNELVGCIYPAA